VTKTYQGLGLSLSYPENWQLTEDFEDGTLVGFQLQSPNTAFLSVIDFPWSKTPEAALDEVRTAIEAEYEEVEVEPIDPPAILTPSDALTDSRAVDLEFYYLDLLVHIRLIAFSQPHHTYLVQMQAEDRDFTACERVFEAMLYTLIQSTALGKPQP
jgi:hypothetical protein